MYAVIKHGGKQYKIKEGLKLNLEKIEVGVGETIIFDEVLLVSKEDDIQVGTPFLDNAKVTAEVISQGRAKKVKIIKFRRRKHSMTRLGHRQYYTEVKINTIAV